ncbi:MAG: hypothetical protein WCI93_00830 [bacterium]
MLKEHLDKNNLHHAYLIEGNGVEIVPSVLEFVESIGVKTTNNSDFIHIVLDSFKIDDARDLRTQSLEKGISTSKKVFVLSVNNFLIEAQNTLLKMFEEPIPNTMFFLVIPDSVVILPTLLSRLYLIRMKDDSNENQKEAENFLKMSSSARIDFIKEMIAKAKEDDEEELLSADSVRSKAIKFLNTLEKVLHEKLISNKVQYKEVDYFYQIMKAREYLLQPGSSTKSLMESVALVVPKF